MVGLLVGLLVGWFVCWLVGWSLHGWLVGLFAGQLVWSGVAATPGVGAALDWLLVWLRAPVRALRGGGLPGLPCPAPSSAAPEPSDHAGPLRALQDPRPRP
eukprot:9495953-Pyramimonas_sp.AAC.1